MKIFSYFFSGYFWHITDLHLDSAYSTKGDVTKGQFNLSQISLLLRAAAKIANKQKIIEAFCLYFWWNPLIIIFVSQFCCCFARYLLLLLLPTEKAREKKTEKKKNIFCNDVRVLFICAECRTMDHHQTNSATRTLGRFGDYLCESPWSLLESATQAMKSRQGDNVEFVLWTG